MLAYFVPCGNHFGMDDNMAIQRNKPVDEAEKKTLYRLVKAMNGEGQFPGKKHANRMRAIILQKMINSDDEKTYAKLKEFHTQVSEHYGMVL